ncbi:MAG: metal-dependent transcriptional regulator [Anaerovoracaceae bacterium]|nr:metal-dependent transcriptional regulator [Anaerovoracaceae bacterium]
MLKTMESAENYLETILILKTRNGSVRSIDIAHELDFSKPSVSVAMKRLREKEYITVEDGGLIEFTEKGRKLAERIYERHVLLTKALVSLGVDPETAAEDACRVEHYISQETFDKIKEHFNDHIK